MRFRRRRLTLKTWWHVRVVRPRRRRRGAAGGREFPARLEREAEAAAMLPHTRFGSGVAATMVLAFLGPLAVLGVVRAIPARSGTGARGDVLDGARPYAQQVLSGWGRASNSQVTLGANNWLFYGLGVQHVTGPGFLAPEQIALGERLGMVADPRAAMVSFRDQLAARGIKLIVLPVPDKTTLYPEELWPGYGREQAAPDNASVEQWKREMRAQNVTVFDPTSLLLAAKDASPDSLYVPTDSHWTPRGAQVTAQGLAAWVKGTANLPERTPTAYRVQYSVTPGPGDLVHLLGLPRRQSMFAFPSLPLREIHEGAGYYTSPADADILLIGDSFAGYYEGAGASLASELAYELRRPVDYISIPNGGSWAARFAVRDSILNGHDRLRGKKLVIWEFTARDLSSGDWKPCTLPPVAAWGAAGKGRTS